MTQNELRIINTQAKITKTKTLLDKGQKKLTLMEEKLPECLDFDLEYDISVCKEDIMKKEREIKELKIKLKSYQEKQAEIDRKNDIPYIEALEAFLSDYSERITKFYTEQSNRANLAIFKAENFKQQEHDKLREAGKLSAFFNPSNRNADWVREIKNSISSYRENLLNVFDSFTLMVATSPNRAEAIQKFVESNVQSLRLDIYWRAAKICGVLTDCSNLYVANNGCLNGFVVGEQGKARIETIEAGGYNIQCLHYRVLIKELR